MGLTYTSIPTHLIPWLKAQHMFFVASSALAVPVASSCTTPHDINRGSEDEAAGQERGLAYEKSPVWGYANVSPRDMAGFEVLSETCVRYQDLTGSGIETISHLNEPGNGRLTIMFISFEGGPRILRLWGEGKVYERGTAEFDAILPPGDPKIRIGCRAIIELDIKKVGTSCGYSIPYYNYVKDRPILDISAKKQLYRDLGLPLPSTLSSFDPKASDPDSQTRALGDALFDEEDRIANEEAFSELLGVGGQDAGVGGRMLPEGGMRAYWNLKNSRSRDLLMGLRGLAPVNDEGYHGDGIEGEGDGVGEGGECEGDVIHVNVGGDEIKVRKLPGGRGELVTDSKIKPSSPKSATSNATPKPDTTLSPQAISPNKTYSGTEVITLLRTISRQNIQSEAKGVIERQKAVWRSIMWGLVLLLMGVWLGRGGGLGFGLGGGRMGRGVGMMNGTGEL